jgi:hypothetical protein
MFAHGLKQLKEKIDVTIPALIAFNLLVGASVAYSARLQIRTLQRHIVSTRYFISLMMLESMIMLPVGIYFYIFYTDWSWMYLVNTARHSSGIGVMAVIAYPPAAAMGYLVGYYSARSNSDWITLMFMIFIFFGLIGLFIAANNQFISVGTYEQYRRDIGLKSIGATSLIPSILFSTAGIFASWFYLLVRFSKEGRVTAQSFYTSSAE